MTDVDRIVRLLEEMRDVQRQQLEYAKTAIENQEQAVRRQTEMADMAKRRLRSVPFLIILALFLVIGVLLLMVTRMF